MYFIAYKLLTLRFIHLCNAKISYVVSSCFCNVVAADHTIPSGGSRGEAQGHVPPPPFCPGVKKIKEDRHSHDSTSNIADIYITSELII